MEIIRIAKITPKKIFGPYRRKSDGRQIVIVVEKGGKRRTVSYPKWLMEMHLGKKLDPNTQTVDHIDSNFDNNNIDNLRIMPRNEHSAEDTRRVKNHKFECAWCDKEFERSPRLIRDKSKKNKAGPFCSRSCAGKYSRMLQLKLVEKMGPQPFVESEYFKKKYVVEASSEFYDGEIDIDFDDLVLYAQEEDEFDFEKGAMDALLSKFLRATS